MVRFYSILAAGLLSLGSVNAMANTQILISTMPQDREVIRPPRGYMHCQQIPASYDRGVWVNQHQFCEYTRNRGTWVSGYWQCSQLLKKSICMRWEWMPSHWERPRVVYDQGPRHHGQPAPIPSHGRHHSPTPIVGPQPPATPIVEDRQPAPRPIARHGQPSPSPITSQPSAQPY